MFATGFAIELRDPSEAEERMQRRPHAHTGAMRASSRYEGGPRDSDRGPPPREIFFDTRGRSTGRFMIAAANVADPDPTRLLLPRVGEILVGFAMPSTHAASRFKFEFRQWTHRAAPVALLHRLANHGSAMSASELRGALRLAWSPSSADALFALARLAVYGDMELFESRLRIEAGLASSGPIRPMARDLCLGVDVNTFVRQSATAFNDFELLEEWTRLVRRITVPSLIDGLSLREVGSSPTPPDEEDLGDDLMESPTPWKTPLPPGYRPFHPVYDPSSPAYNPTTP